MTKPKPSKHFSQEMVKFWTRIVADYTLDAEHQRILQLACEQFDRAQAAREQIAADGMVIDGKRHPLLGVEAKATEIFLRGIAALGLEVSNDATK